MHAIFRLTPENHLPGYQTVVILMNSEFSIVSIWLPLLWSPISLGRSDLGNSASDDTSTRGRFPSDPHSCHGLTMQNQDNTKMGADDWETLTPTSRVSTSRWRVCSANDSDHHPTQKVALCTAEFGSDAGEHADIETLRSCHCPVGMLPARFFLVAVWLWWLRRQDYRVNPGWIMDDIPLLDAWPPACR